MELNFCKSEEIKQKRENQKNFALKCVLFLTESFFRILRVFQNLTQKKTGVSDFLDKDFLRIFEENLEFIKKKRLGLIQLKNAEENNKNSEEFQSRKMRINRISCYLPANSQELQEIYRQNFGENSEKAEEISNLIKEDDFLRYFLSRERISSIFASFSKEKPPKFEEILKELQEKAFETIKGEFMLLFANYRDFIKEISKQKETLFLKILYYKPEFDIKNSRKSVDLSYFDTETFKKSVNSRIMQYFDFFGLKKTKKFQHKGQIFRRSAIQIFEKEHGKENELEDVFLLDFSMEFYFILNIFIDFCKNERNIVKI